MIYTDLCKAQGLMTTVAAGKLSLLHWRKIHERRYPLCTGREPEPSPPPDVLLLDACIPEFSFMYRD